MSIQEGEDFAELSGYLISVIWENKSFTRFPIFLLLENLGIGENSISLNLYGDIQVDVSGVALCLSFPLVPLADGPLANFRRKKNPHFS